MAKGKRKDPWAAARAARMKKMQERKEADEAVARLADKLGMEPHETILFAARVCEATPDVKEYVKATKKARELEAKLGLE
jgi:hypothetical protein